MLILGNWATAFEVDHKHQQIGGRLQIKKIIFINESQLQK
jgi:hypothetical protein